jgi:hypothetical protein
LLIRKWHAVSRCAVLCCALPFCAESGADWWESQGEPTAPPLPPDSVFDSVLRDLLSPPRPASASVTAAAATAGVGVGPLPGSGTLSRRSSRESAPPSGCLSSSSSGSGPSAAAAAAGQYACSSTTSATTAGPAGGSDAAAAAAAALALPRSAPPSSLLCRLALHALVFGNARAVAALWQRFVIQVGALEG